VRKAASLIQVCQLIYHVLICHWSGHRCLVESATSDPVRLLASMAVIRWVFHSLATRGVEIPLGEFVVGGVTQTKTNTHSNAHLKVESLAEAVFQRNKYVNLACFSKYQQTFECFSQIK